MSIVCIGELLIDFISQDIGNNLANSDVFLKKAGGAPANVAAVISRLGGKSLFCGQVGKDPFGDFLETILLEHNVDTSLLMRDNNASTTLAFVSLDKNGERDFSFIRGADANLDISDIDITKIDTSSIIHFGSATALLPGKLKDTYEDLLKYALKNNKFISFDPNYRSAFWENNHAEFIENSMVFIKEADFLKVSEEELFILSGKNNLEDGIEFLHNIGSKIIAVTLGKDGTLISDGLNTETISSIEVKCIDSTGAGDSFVGAFLHYLNEESLKIYDFSIIKNCVTKANKVAAMVCTKMGAMEALSIISTL